MSSEEAVLFAEESMQKHVEFMAVEFAGVRTGKASPAIVENIEVYVAAYGSAMKLSQLATISTPDARMIMVQPFDPSTIQDISKGLNESKIGINPTVDGKVIRLPIPELSGERRQELAKVVRTMGEEARVRVRSARRDALEVVKKEQKASAITEDDLKLYEKDIQGLTDKFIGQIDAAVTKKETEITTV